MDIRNEKSVLKEAKWPSLRPLSLKSELLQEFELLKKLQRFVWKKVIGEQFLLTSNIFLINPLNLPKIQTAIKTHSSMLGSSDFVTFVFLTFLFISDICFITTTNFYDRQGHVTLSCKEPIIIMRPCPRRTRNYCNHQFEWPKSIYRHLDQYLTLCGGKVTN